MSAGSIRKLLSITGRQGGDTDITNAITALMPILTDGKLLERLGTAVAGWVRLGFHALLDVVALLLGYEVEQRPFVKLQSLR